MHFLGKPNIEKRLIEHSSLLINLIKNEATDSFSSVSLYHFRGITHYLNPL